MEQFDIPVAGAGVVAASLWQAPQPRAVLLQPLVHADIQRRHVAPAEAGLPAIGHMGFFRQRSAAVLWPQVGNWLLAAA
jgi:predicted alpha/beta hydrolase